MDSLLHPNVLESMGEGVLTVTAGGRIGTMNPSASRFLGLDDAEVRGRTITEDLTHREDLEAFNDIVLAAVCDQAVGTRSMIGLRLGDGTERSVAVPDEGTEVEAWREADGSRRKPRVGRLPAPRRVPALHPSLMPWSRTPAPLAADDQTRLLHRRCPSARSAGDGTPPAARRSRSRMRNLSGHRQPKQNSLRRRVLFAGRLARHRLSGNTRACRATPTLSFCAQLLSGLCKNTEVSADRYSICSN